MLDEHAKRLPNMSRRAPIPATSGILPISTAAKLDLFQPRLMKSCATIIIPFDHRVLIVGSLNCTYFSVRLPEVAQTLNPISGIQFLLGVERRAEWRVLGTV
jgi:hypothetical protein